MKTEILIVIIASTASLIVALISLITSIVTNRHSLKMMKVNNRFKFISKLDNNSLEKKFSSLDSIICLIQEMKDQMQLIVADSNESIDSVSAIKEIEKCREKMFNCYENNLPNLSDEERQYAHTTKNQIHGIEIFIKKSLKGRRFASEIDTDSKKQLQEQRSELTEYQDLIRDVKMTLFTNLIN